jgi:hypothetical protein
MGLHCRARSSPWWGCSCSILTARLPIGSYLVLVLARLESWRTWLVVLKAAFDRPLDDDEVRVFRQVAGDRFPPDRRVRELWCVCGRGSGKSRVAAAIAIYLALFVKHKLAAGERGVCLVLAGTVDQAGVVLGYIRGFLEASPALRREVAAVRRYEIELRSGLILGVHPNSFRSIRGRTLVACVFDETAFWRDETSSQPDVEVYTAVLPALAREWHVGCDFDALSQDGFALHEVSRLFWRQQR